LLSHIEVRLNAQSSETEVCGKIEIVISVIREEEERVAPIGLWRQVNIRGADKVLHWHVNVKIFKRDGSIGAGTWKKRQTQ
jgi:hypothetical protein